MRYLLKQEVHRLRGLPNPDMCVAVDIETNALLLKDITDIHAICFTFSNRKQLRYSTLPGDMSIEKGVRMLHRLILGGITPIFHNGAGYDIRVLQDWFSQLQGVLSVYNTIDTLLLSCILDPDRKQGHSIESYGEEMGIPKVQNEKWDVCTPHMVNRCLIDTKIGMEVYKKLYAKAQRLMLEEGIFSALTLESEVSYIHQKQWNHGVYYNLEQALKHWGYLQDETLRLKDKIQKEAPWTCSIVGVAKMRQDDVKSRTSLFEDEEKHKMGYREVLPFKKDGNLTANTIKYFGEEEAQKVKGTYVKIDCQPLALSNSEDVKEYLRSLGWKPTEWNYTFKDGRKQRTSPKLTEDSYISLPEGLGQDIASYNTLTHRMRSILNVDDKTGDAKGAVSLIREDGRISAEAITCGTPTARYRHMKAVCNIPRPSSVFGKEIRETFGVDPEHTQIGIDLSGIESRMLAHYLCEYIPINHEIIKAILNTDKGNDFHSRNAKLWGVSRDIAKNGLYALMYGCYPKKLATTLGYDESKGQELYDDFWRFNEPIKLLVDELEKAYTINGGYIIGLDGRPLFVREKRKLLNTLLQNAATVVFKRWMVMCDRKLRGFVTCPVHQIIAYHDELQFEVYSQDMQTVKGISHILSKLSIDAGKYYNVKVPTPAEAKIGMSWADCH